MDQSKSSLDRGGSATLDAFLMLAPRDSVQVLPVLIKKKTNKPPLVKCISNSSNRPSLEVAQVDSVDKVYRILTKHMKVEVGDGQRMLLLLPGKAHASTNPPDSIHVLFFFSEN